MSEKTTTPAKSAKATTAKPAPAAEKTTAKGDFVLINSTVTINVTMGLQAQDATNPDAHVPDRLKVNPLWPKATVLIKQGAHYYPAMIAEWPAVKLLAKDKIITIGQFSNTCEGEDQDAVAEKQKELDRAIEEIELRESGKKPTGSLEDLAEE